MKFRRLVVVGVLGLFTCTPQKSTLELSFNKSRIDADGEAARLAIVAVANGTYGAGKVTVSADIGPLTTPVAVELDSLGLAYVEVSCDAATDSSCAGTMTVTAKWVPAGGSEVSETVPLKLDSTNSTDAGSGSGGGAGGGGGGGAGGGGGSGGGPTGACDREPDGGVPQVDIIEVSGQAGSLGAVNYRLRGSSAGASGADGLQRFTGGTLVGTPEGVDDTGLWAWYQPGVDAGVTYAADNSEPSSHVPPFLNFRISYEIGGTRGQITCPRGAGSGQFTMAIFNSFTVTPLATGTYTFQCPDAGINVSGCFYYR